MTKTLALAFDRHGALNSAQSDLSGDEKRDGAALTDPSGFQ